MKFEKEILIYQRSQKWSERKGENMPRHGENIRKRTDGRWEGRYTVYLPGKGRQQISIYGKTYSEVKRKRQDALEASNEKNLYSKNEIFFEDALQGWHVKIKKTKKPATYVKYCSIYETYLEDILTNYPLSEMTTDYFQEMLTDKIADCSESIRKSIYSVLTGALNYSAENYHTLPVRLKRAPSPRPTRKLDIYTKEEQTVFLRYLYTDMSVTKMGIVLCLSTGLRLGEVCALKWEDINFQKKVLNVNHTVQRMPVNNHKKKTALCEGTPKTNCSQREVPLSDEILQLLSKFKHQGKYVLNNKKPLEPRTYQYQFQKFQQEAGITCRNFHVLRHTFATNCIGSGIDVKSLSEILGHSDVHITLNKYVHPTLDTKRQHMNTISSIYGQIIGQNI